MRTTPHTSTQQTALRGLGAALGLLALCAVVLFLAGCQSRVSRGIVAEQKPGLATGAGATFTGPANSAAASTQIAQRRVAYYAPTTTPNAAPTSAATAVAAPLPVRSEPAPTVGQGLPLPSDTPAPFSSLPPVPSGPPAPAWIDERTETTLGQHQDAAGLVKAATAIGSWGRARWFGILCILAAIGGLLYAHGNPEGYPVVCWKVGAVGVFLATFDPSPWWLLLLLIPAGFYVTQKLNLLRLP